MKKWLLIGVLLLAACADDGVDTSQDIVTDVDIPVSDGEETVTSSVGLNESYYQSVIPYELSPSRGLTSTNMVSTYNIESFEAGLLEHSKEVFSVEDYYFREGQVFTSDIVRGYLSRAYSEDEIADMSDEERESSGAFSNMGLNPSVQGETNEAVIAENYPRYLSHILEQNYMVENEDGEYDLSGMTIGLALNSEHLYRRDNSSSTQSMVISESDSINFAEGAIEEILERLRANEAYEDIDILFAVYIQSGRYDIVPGKFVMTAFSPAGETEVESFESVEEEFELLPSTGETIVTDAINAEYRNFNTRLTEYFDNFSQTIGLARFKDGQFTELNVTIPIDYTSRSEVVAMAQHVKDILLNSFAGIEVEVVISSAHETYAVITKDSDDNISYYMFD